MTNLLLSLVVIAVSYIILYYIIKTAVKNGIIESRYAINQNNQGCEGNLSKTICPFCQQSHDIDYPKCPYCKHQY